MKGLSENSVGKRKVLTILRDNEHLRYAVDNVINLETAED